MGRKSKKVAKNAFSFFLEDYVESERKRGRIVSYRIAAEECAPLWKELPQEAKERYSNTAAAFKENKNKEDKFTNAGISYAEVERQQNQLKKKMESADAELKMTISNLDSDLLKTHLFYIIHCNYYCKTADGIYVPGELAIAEFSLGDGIRRTYHTLINPGPIPLGYAFEAKKTIEEIHGLPFPPFDEGNSDYFSILDKILHFLEPGKLPDGRYPPLYCIESNVKASENILSSLSENQTESSNFFRVFFLHKMFFWLKNKCVEGLDDELVGFPVMANAESEITRDMFCYVPGISCSFHVASEDKYQSCSLSVVQRYVYVICDHCCQHIGVPLVPGKHCRLKTDINRQEAHPHRKSRRNHPAPSIEPSDCDFDGESSYIGKLSSRDCKEGGEACSFLHDELEGKFHGLDVSSIASRTSRSGPSGYPDSLNEREFPQLKPRRNVHAVGCHFAVKMGRKEDSSSEEEDMAKVLSLGRGTRRR